MKPTLIGSRALAFWDNSFKAKESSDWDFIVEDHTNPKLPDAFGGRIELHRYDELNNRDVSKKYSVNFGSHSHYKVMSLEGLALLKRSHLWRQRFFEKHIYHYHWFLKKHSSWFDLEWVKLLKDRIKLTEEAYPQSNPSLKKTNEDFFDDAVKKKFDHDWLHELVTYYDKPLYTRLKNEGKEDKAWCEKDLWENLSHEDKIRCVAEEAHVIACERFMIPSGWKKYQRPAYIDAVNKVCTTLTSGWFRDFAIDNYPEVLAKYDKTKFEKVRKETDETY